MIFACPACSASHFKPDSEAKAGVDVTCRRCKTRFRVTAAGVEALPPESEAAAATTPAADAPAAAGAVAVDEVFAAETAKTVVGAPAHFALATDVIAVPQGFAAGGLADALEPEPVESAPSQAAEPESSSSAAAASESSSAALGPTPFGNENSITQSNPDGLSSESTRVLDGPSLGVSTAPTKSMSFESGSGELPPMQSLHPAGRESIPEAATVVTGERMGLPRSVTAAEDSRRSRKTRRSMTSLLSVATDKSRDISRRFSAAPPQRKAIMLAVPVGILVIIVMLIALSGGPPPVQKQWVSAPASMWSGPAAQRGYIQIDTLLRGEEVIFLHEVYGDYSLVRDVWGRVGYVNHESLSDAQPPVTPEAQFPGCRQAPIEADKEACESRARTTHDTCGAACAADSRCLARCQDRFVECIDGCKTRLTVPAPPAAAETAETAEAAEGDEAPAEGDQDTAEAGDTKIAEKPIKGAKGTKTTHPLKKVTKKRTKH